MVHFRLFLLFIICWLALPLQAQEEDRTPYEIALQRIEEARITGAEELDLSNLDLKEVPPEIGQLTSLCRLNLMNNELRRLPTEIGSLSRLETRENCPPFPSLLLDGNPFVPPMPELIEEGTPAILEFLRHQNRYYMQRILITAGFGWVVIALLFFYGYQSAQRGGRKPKKKRDVA